MVIHVVGKNSRDYRQFTRLTSLLPEFKDKIYYLSTENDKDIECIYNRFGTAIKETPSLIVSTGDKIYLMLSDIDKLMDVQILSCFTLAHDMATRRKG